MFLWWVLTLFCRIRGESRSDVYVGFGSVSGANDVGLWHLDVQHCVLVISNPIESMLARQ
jgi:hypothetical protein